MRLQLKVGWLGVMLVASTAWTQSTVASGGSKAVISDGGLLHTLAAAPVIAQPYPAVQVHTTVQKLANGTTIRQQGHHSVARDSEGRTRTEMRMAEGQNGEPDTVMVVVRDPVAHTLTTWVEGAKNATKVASVVKLPNRPEGQEPMKPVPVRTRATSARPEPVVTTEDLGMDTLQGLPVSVVRTTTVVPPGRAGNDAPITRTVEVWTSPDLKLVMKQQWEDPRIGERTVALEKFSRAEPDASLFRAPRGYVVKDALQSLKETEDKLGESQN